MTAAEERAFIEERDKLRGRIKAIFDDRLASLAASSRTVRSERAGAMVAGRLSELGELEGRILALFLTDADR